MKLLLLPYETKIRLTAPWSTKGMDRSAREFGVTYDTGMELVFLGCVVDARDARVGFMEKSKTECWVKVEDANKLDFEIGWTKRFTRWQRYQDGGWTKIDDEEFEVCNDAIAKASELSKNAIAYGMVEVRDAHGDPTVVLTFPAGGFRP